MKNESKQKMFDLYYALFSEFKETSQTCLLEIEKTSRNEIIINFYITIIDI